MPIFAVPIAEIAQLVEHDLAKVGVASSSLVFRSKGQFTADLFSCPDLPGCSSNSRPRVTLRRRAGEDMKVRVSTSQTWVRVSFSALKVSLPLTFFRVRTSALYLELAAPGRPPSEGRGGYENALEFDGEAFEPRVEHLFRDDVPDAAGDDVEQAFADEVLADDG